MRGPGESGVNHRRIGELFGQVLAAAPQARAALLQAVALDEPEVVAQVRSLLAAHRGDGMLDAELDTQKSARLIETLLSQPRQIGPYNVVRELGRGGMGVVYLGERTEGGFEQRVALKLIQRGMDSEAILARFLQERQILARLEHPGIARLLEGGLAVEGQPYFAMEYIEGEPITRFCRRHEFGLRRRLDLFVAVCQAVQYAHGRLVVHRDLKPSNVLVTADGVVKLVDFGIAKVLDAAAAGSAALTVVGALVLTPDYASPEQIRGAAVTVASDVYSLGILLYELLAGRSPYPMPLTTAEEIRRAVCETTPPAPSVALLSDETSTQGERAQERLARRIRGDLDLVVLTALAKDTGDRYPSVEALLEEIHRFRQGLPVRVRRAGWLYRVGKFAGRHRFGVAAAAAVFLALVLGLVGTAWQATEAARERDRARLESDKLRATQEYLVALFDAADPAQSRGKEITAKQLVARGIEQLNADLTDQPEVRLEMLRALGRVSGVLGEYDDALLLLDQALQLTKTLRGEQDRAVADVLAYLGLQHNAKGAWAEAVKTLDEAVARYDRFEGGDRSLVFHALGQLAFAHKSQGDLERAILFQQRALEEARQLFGNGSNEVAFNLNNLGNILKRVGDYEGAESALAEALAIWKAVHGGEYPLVATATGNLAVVLFRQGDWRRAEPLYREGIAMKRRLQGDRHPNLAPNLHNFAVFLHALGRFEEAAELHREVLPLVLEGMGETSPYYASTLDSLALDLAGTGRFAEAMPLFASAERRFAETVGKEHELYVFNLWHHAVALHLQGLDPQANSLIEQALPLGRGLQRRENLPTMLADQGSIQLALGRTEEAAKSFQEALQMQRDTLPAKHPSLVQSLVGLGWTWIARERLSEADDVLSQAVEVADEALPREHWRAAEARAALAVARLRLEREAAGELLLRESHAQLKAARGPDHPATRRVARYLPWLGQNVGRKTPSPQSSAL